MRSTFRRFLFNTTLAGTFLLSGAAFAQEEAAAEPVAEEAVPEVEEEAAPAAAEAPAEEAAPAAEEPKKETSIAADETVYAEMSLEDLLGVAVEISSTKAQTIFSTPSTVSVIDRSAIQSFGFTSVADAVERVAGVSVLRTYLKRNIPTIRGVLQTHYANKVLVLIDGVPAWHAVTGEGSLDRVGIDMVERIEVLRGPASVLYGTNAYSGAINIVTRRATKTGGSLDFSAGDKRSTSAAASYSYIDGDLKFFVGASGNDEQGDSYLYKDYQDVEGRVF
ncbi:TonB-dependent receptor plug domain-containing protein, partial [Myxococcota bacterium]|nr:TonB-dependent receptor plug domain-containing protein [Myxococcota bacterium]